MDSIINLAENTHRRLFGHVMSVTMRRFLGNLSWSFLGGGIASVVMLGLNILAGRLIGPEGYGKYNLALAASQFLMIPMIFGIDAASVRSVAISKTKREQSQNISATLAFVFTMVLVTTLLFFLLGQPLAQRLSWDKSILFLGLWLAVFTSLKTVLDGLIRGLGFFKFQFGVRLLEVAMGLAIFWLLFHLYERNTVASYVYVLVGGSALASIFFLVKLMPYFANFKKEVLKTQLSYARVLMTGSIINVILTTVDKLLIARYLSLAALGVYGAYFTASTNLMSQLVQMVINVFYPAVAQAENKKVVVEKIDRLAKQFLVPGAVFMSGVVWLIVALFGDKYGVRWSYVLSFGSLAMLQMILSLYTYVIMAISQALYRQYLIAAYSVYGVQMLTYILLIVLGVLSVQAIVLLLIANVSVTIFLQRRMLNREFGV